MKSRPIEHAIANQSRRQFFGNMAAGIGTLALANLLSEDAACSQESRLRRIVRPSTFCTESEALHLSAHDGRATSNGSARL